MINKISKKWLGLILCFSLVMGTVSCQLFHDAFDGRVVTTEDNVKPEAREFSIDAPMDLLPKEAREKLLASGKKLVIVDEEDVIAPENAVKIETPNDGTLGNVLHVGLGIANTIWPGVAVLEGLGLLFSPRKRQHYATAIKAVTPYDGDVAIKEAVISIARGMGLAHSSESSKEVFKEGRKAA